MLFLSSGLADVTLRNTVIDPLPQQGKTIYDISAVLNETVGDVPVSMLGMGPITNNLLENCHPGAKIMSLMPMESSPRLGRAQRELNLPSLSSTGRCGRQRQDIVVEENEEELEEVEEKMKMDRFAKQRSKSSDGRVVAKITALEEPQKHHVHASTSHSVTVHVRGLAFGDHGRVTGHNSLPRAVLRRPRQDEHFLGRRPVSMCGEPINGQRDSLPEKGRFLRRPRSISMLAGPDAALVTAQIQIPPGRTGILENNQYRNRKAELRAVDGLSSAVAQWPSATVEVTPRVRQRNWKPRPVSMTVLELRKISSDDEIESQRNCSHKSSDSGFLKGGFRWRLFGKLTQDKSNEKDIDKETQSSSKLSRTDSPKSTLSSLRRSLSLRIRRNRPRDKSTIGSEGESKHWPRDKHSVEETAPSPQPFSYLTGRTLSTANEQREDGAVQYFQYQSKGKVKVMAVPLYPTKLSSKPVQEEPSFWQLIANRFRRKDQPNTGKSGIQQPQSKNSGQCPLAPNDKSQAVAIETVGMDSYKGQGKILELSSALGPWSEHK